MHIQQKRIRNLDGYLKGFEDGVDVVVALRGINDYKVALANAGFSSRLDMGESVLPAAIFGPVSQFNAHGKDKVHKDEPMETAYRSIWWTWIERHGRYKSVEKSDVRYLSYRRYPRTPVPPAGIELEVAADKNGQKLVVAPAIKNVTKSHLVLLHTINLFLEIFGECDLVTSNLESIVHTKIIRLNWHLLPPGRHPWKDLQKALDPIIKAAPGGNQPLIQRRLETVHGYNPEFQAVGRGGFNGYVVFGFPKKNLFIFESAYVGNATYVFEQNWEDLSTLSKAEILDGKLQKARIVHLQNWSDDIYKLLK